MAGNQPQRIFPEVSYSPKSSPRIMAMSASMRSEQPSTKDFETPGASRDNLFRDVSDWLEQERTRRMVIAQNRSPIVNSYHVDDTDIALEQLERILQRYTVQESSKRSSIARQPSNPYFPHRKSSTTRLTRNISTVYSSDTDNKDLEESVPSTNVVLDNSKTMSYFQSRTSDEDERAVSKRKRAAGEKEAWATFKLEITKLTHTLKVKGWRRVPLERSSEVEVARLSGALTNAVYVVSPPKKLEHKTPSEGESTPKYIRPPPKLLLRIYGPQVEHLIDRESELQILRRLTRKNIGPRVLGTFLNGRFEQFLDAITLTHADLRIPETSRHIAKRMRELHDGIELLAEERAAGPFVWQNWDKWVNRCRQICEWLDAKAFTSAASRKASTNTTVQYVCGAPWAAFHAAVTMYRKWLEKQYGGIATIKEKLVFAHNDTQYGNLLRLKPSTESPLLLPVNQHKQLVVIDFEYANANLPGLEFANHFTEWCYDYHSETIPHALLYKSYPKPDEQARFFRAYLQHKPSFPSYDARPSPGPSPSMMPLPSSINSFMLDARSPAGLSSSNLLGAPAMSYEDEERKREQELDKQVQQLEFETRLWRAACSTQWVAWGIVQAKIPEFEAEQQKQCGSSKEDHNGPSHLVHDTAVEPHEAASQNGAEHEDDEVAEFDYLQYAQQRALFFWGDMLALGVMEEKDLPQEVRGKAIRLDY